ncbi:MAG: aerotolerance regulator BatD [Alteromonas sp. Nap_26]|nr:MAG: aerotolerance regulator BatD [Alteromonas sp. Nap_26]
MKFFSVSTFFIFTLLSLMSASALADINSLEATIDKNPVMVDEAIRLTVTADGSADRDAFDSSPLLKDFVVGRTSVSSQTSIVNFDTKRTTVWTTTLFPRKEGIFTIPSLTVENKQTKPIQVEVIPVQAQDNVARDYFVTTDIDLKDAYLNQQLLYTVKLFLSSNIERGSLQAPEMQNAEITQLGEDKQYTDIINGRRYQIIERQFAVVPQASGEFTLRGPIFTGEVMAPNTNQRFGFFNRTQQVNRVGPDITVNIKPIPQNIDYAWLPSEMVRVDEEWPQGDNFVAGEPVTRIITLTALGVVEEQLPDIPEFYPPNFKLYPDQSTTATVEKDQNLISQRQSSLAIIPTAPGSFVLPEITIPWFNTLTEKTEYATIPARTITVAPASGQASNGQAPNTSTSTSTNNQEQASVPAQTPNSLSNSNNGISDQASDDLHDNPQDVIKSPLFIIVTTVLAILWLITLVAWYVARRKLKQHSYMNAATNSFGGVSGANFTNTQSEKDAFNQLIQVVKRNDINQLDRALGNWLRVMNNNGKGKVVPGDIAETQPLTTHINALQALRFSKDAKQKSSDASALKSTFSALEKSLHDVRKQSLAKRDKTENRLSNLYPVT